MATLIGNGTAEDLHDYQLQVARSRRMARKQGFLLSTNRRTGGLFLADERNCLVLGGLNGEGVDCGTVLMYLEGK